MSQVIKVSPSTAVTSGSNNPIDENNRNDTDSERGATTHTYARKPEKFRF